jgi:SPX domain protein involved in polyphosphate accumulation
MLHRFSTYICQDIMTCMNESSELKSPKLRNILVYVLRKDVIIFQGIAITFHRHNFKKRMPTWLPQVNIYISDQCLKANILSKRGLTMQCGACFLA